MLLSVDHIGDGRGGGCLTGNLRVIDFAPVRDPEVIFFFKDLF